MNSTKRTTIYVDGFNLYYGCLKHTPYKWLDLKVLFSKLLDKTHDIKKIKYFTAHISNRPGNNEARYADFIKMIRHHILQDSQLPEKIINQYNGEEIYKPKGW